MKKEVKVIFHIDLNAFYATVAQINEPYLKNKVFVVGGSPVSGRGVITTASYNARRLGITSGMSINEAMRIYPKVIIVPLEFKEYRKYSNIFFDFLSNYSDKMIRGSIDEAYIDMSEMAKERNAIEIAKEIQDRLVKEHQLPVSIGIAPTLFLAKMASDLKKPLGITVVRRRDIVSKILPLPIKDLFGMGIKTYPLMETIGVKRIGDFILDENREKILKIIKEDSYYSFLNHILGKSTDIVNPSKYDIPKSISNENTLNYPMEDYELILNELRSMLRVVHDKLTKSRLLAKTVNIKLRTSDFDTFTRSKSLDDFTNDFDKLNLTMETLFFDNYEDDPLRLIGAGVSNIILASDYEEDYNLFTYQKLLEE